VSNHANKESSAMAHHEDEATPIERVLEVLTEHGLEGMAEAIETLMNAAMRIERSEFLRAAPGERSSERIAHANGFKGKRVRSRVGELSLRVPQVRALPDGEPVSFYPRALERGLRSERALKLAIAEMYVQGVSTRRVTEITRELCGLEVTSTQVSRAAAELDAQLSAWRERELGRCTYLVLDARYEKVRHGGSVVDCAVLVAMGVREADGKRMLLGVSVSLSEAEVHWRAFLESLQRRGLQVTTLITSDDHAGLRAARRAVFPNVPWQRCQFHLQQNAQAYVPQLTMRAEVARDLRAVFNAPDRGAAEEQLRKVVEKYRKPAPKLAEWMETNVPEGLNVFALPEAHRRRMRTVNGLERVNGELHRRTRVATLFPNEPSLLRLVSALAAEISEEWETGRAYLAPSGDVPKIGSRGCPQSDDLDPPRSRGTPRTRKNENPS
jgi:transposase-like protein